MLSYSGLGFGGSSCKITLDDPDYDGKAGSQLVSFLGGAPDIAYTDAEHTKAVKPLNVVVHDKRDHAGTHVALRPARRHDRRLVRRRQPVRHRLGRPAGRHDRPDHHLERPDLLARPEQHRPDHRGDHGQPGHDQADLGPAVLGRWRRWTACRAARAIRPAWSAARTSPTFVCPALVTGGATGYFQPDAISAFRHASVAHYMKKIKIPMLLIQGENDTLFNLNEASPPTRRCARSTPR